MRIKGTSSSVILTTMIFVMALSLGSFTTSEYVRARGIDYLEQGNQIKRHQAVLDGHAGNPWQYRVLAPYMVSIVLGLFEDLHIPNHISASFIFSRVVQDTIILLLACAYYRRLGLPLLHALIGMALLAWGMSYSHYDSDLQFSTFFDIIFYLLAGLCILNGKFAWIVPITLLAALNRETSGLIPFLLIAVATFALPAGSLQKVMPVFVTACLTYVAIFVGLRLVYGSQHLFIPYGHQAGFDLLQYNLFRVVTWRELIATVSIIPIVAVIGYAKWPLELRLFFWVIVPIWLAIHAFGAVLAESRLLLVPQAMVFVPGALLSVVRGANAPDDAAASL